MKKVVIIAVVAVILAGFELGYTFLVSEASLRSYENLKAEIQTINSDLEALTADLQSKLSSLEARVSALESKRPLMIRISIDLKPNRVPPGLTGQFLGEDWLIDTQIEFLNGTILSQSRTGHSRFFKPTYLDLTILNFDRAQLVNKQVKITLAAYWHADDVLIDINPNEHWPENWDKWSLRENALIIYYTVGTVQANTIVGYGSNWLVGQWRPLYSYATLTYNVETM